MKPLDVPVPDFRLAAKAYALHAAVDMVVRQVGDVLSDESLPPVERRRLTLARTALRAAKTHLLTIVGPSCLPVDDQQLCDETPDSNLEG